MKKKGTVYLVGAGPGDAGLLTLRGAELLARAEVVVYDALVNSDILRMAPRGAEILYGGRRASDKPVPAKERIQVLIQKARAGKTVVRLKGGDPYIFGRGGEEAEELAAAGIPFEVVPGVSSMSAVPGYAGIPLTHREHCSSFVVASGHDDPESGDASVDWSLVAKTPGTKVVMMGTERIGKIATALVAGGMKKSTPVALVRWGTTGRQESIAGTLGTIGAVVERASFAAPTVAVIGGVVGLRGKLNWFENRPLFGRRVVVTRASGQAAGELSRKLFERGAEVLEVPTIRIEPPENKEALKDALLALHEYDWIVFTSVNGVTAFFDYFFKAFEDLRDIGGLRIAAVGASTAAKLAELHLKVDLMPKDYTSANIIQAFKECQDVENLRILLMRAEVANRELPRELEKLGAIVDDAACYRTVPETEDPHGTGARLLEQGAHWITFTSGSTVEHFQARFPLPELLKKFPEMKLASIGPETTKAIARLGLKPAVEAAEHTIDGLIEAISRPPTAGRKRTA